MFGLSPTAILGTAGAWLASVLLAAGVSGWLFYQRGHDDMRNAVTEQALAATTAELKKTEAKVNRAAAAGADHDKRETQVIHDTRTILKTVTIPPDSDPYVPVWFVRLHDRSASRWAGGDPYPGKSDGDPSDVRLSQAVAMLAANYESCEVNRGRLTDIIDLKPVMPAQPEAPPRDFLDRINPANW